MQIVSLDSKFTPLLNRLARMPTSGPIPLAVGYAPQSSVTMSAMGPDPKVSAVSRMRNVTFKVPPPTGIAPIVMADFWRTALASAQKKETKKPEAPNPLPWYLQGVSPSEDLLALLRTARTAPMTSTTTSKYIAGQTGAATARGHAGGNARSTSLLELAYGNAPIPQAQVGRRGAGRGRIDIQKVNEGVNLAGETVDMVGKVFPELGLPIEGLGEIVNVAAIITSGVGIADALQRGDKRALIGCSLTAGASVLGLIGALSGDTSLLTAGMIVKWSKSGWTYVFPSEPPAKAPPFSMPGSTPLWPVPGSPTPWPVLGSTPVWPVPGSTPPRPAPGLTPSWPVLGSLLDARGLSSWTYDPVSRTWTKHPPGGG